ncbi:hypothetical protein [Nocardioides pelophilus]|uniref:hypothetical protein n=1 Tax=Nocardioides pelophilus TaxID=2172019 RepID=UPI00160052C7|nr:hypothetical protein [Nocardioides pelophilus]
MPFARASRPVLRLAAVAAVVSVAGCGSNGDGNNGDGNKDRRPGSSRPGSTTVSDPVGDTENSINLGDPSETTVDVDVEAVTLDYGRSGLRVTVAYAEPLDPHPEPANLIVHITARGSFDDEVLKWYDGRRPHVVGEDGVRTACRPPASEVDHPAGLVELTVPTGQRCLSEDDPPGKVTVSVTAWGGGAVDFVDKAVVTLP